MGLIQGELPLWIQGKWTKEEKRGEGRDGNGWAPGVDPGNERVKVVGALGSRKTYKCELRS